MIPVYSNHSLPTTVTKTIMLAGPTPRSKDVPSWRPEALRILKELGYDGHVFIPEYENGPDTDDFDYTGQVDWETNALNYADVIVFWVPREMKTMPALTTNVEFGMWIDSGKVVLGAPDSAFSVKYLIETAKNKIVPHFNTLEDTLKEAVARIGSGAKRTEGESQIPLLIWNHNSFQKWYNQQRLIGNEIQKAKVLWNFRVGKKRDFVFSFSMLVHVWIKEENRVKTNEFILGRTDLTSLVLFYRPSHHTVHSYLATQIVLVKEFRSPVNNSSGFVYELPGGSSKNTAEETLSVIGKELEEETSFKIDLSRLKLISTKQVASTFSIHKNTVFACEITKEELEYFKELEKSGKTFGVAEDTEITYVHVAYVHEILDKDLVDWSNIGMIFTVLNRI
jgi:hypothetical protein